MFSLVFVIVSGIIIGGVGYVIIFVLRMRKLSFRESVDRGGRMRTYEVGSGKNRRGGTGG